MVYAVARFDAGGVPGTSEYGCARGEGKSRRRKSSFDRVLKFGLARLNEELQGTFTGEKAFHLYETYGLPLDFMVDAAAMLV